jgi:hypothetical protein
MEGSDAKVLIAKRMGVPKDEVDTRLIALSQKGELDGTAGRSAGRSSSNRALGNSGKSPTLTKKDLDDFERAEADARSGNARSGTPFKPFKPAVLNGNATPKTPRTPPPARSETPPAPTPAIVHDDEVELIPNIKTSWIDEMDAEEGDMQGDVEEGTAAAAVAAVAVAEEQGVCVSEGSGGECNPGVTVGAEVWPETRKRYAEAVEAEQIYSAVSDVTVPLLDEEDLGVEQLQFVVRDIVGQVNTAHKLLATAGYVVAERSKEALQQARISSDMATESLLKAYEVAAVAASSSRQSWKMCVILTGPDMPSRSKESEKRPDTAARYLAQSLFGVFLKSEEVAICHFRGPTSNEFIIKFTRTGFSTSHEDLLHASKAMGRNRELQVYAKIAPADVDSEIYFLLRCMVKAGEAENSYTARSGRAAAWLPQDDGTAAVFSFSTVMEVRALMGPASRQEEAKRMAVSQTGRRKRALTREAVGSGLVDAVREMGMTEDVIRDESRESGVKGGGISKVHKADVAIYRGIKMDSITAWANYGRGRGTMGARGMRGGGSLALGDGLGRGSSRGRGELRGRGGGRGRGKSEGRGGVGTVGARGRGGANIRKQNSRRGRGLPLTGSNISPPSDETTDRKRKLVEVKTTDTKKVKLMQVPVPTAPPTPSTSAAAPSTAAPATASGSKSKNLLDILMRGEKLDVGKGFRLFE